MNGMRFWQGAAAPTDVAEETIAIDVTPVMNMFIILIPFLVSMAVFTHVAIIDFSLPPNVGSGLDDSQGKPKLKLTVVVAADYVAITRGADMLDSVGNRDGAYRLDSLRLLLPARRQAADIQDEAVVAVQDRIRFKHVVDVMDICRESGFDKVGLSSAPEAVATVQ